MTSRTGTTAPATSRATRSGYATLAEPFQRGTQRTRADDHAGIGLGLAIAQRIVQAHDGSLHLTARPDGGLNVTVWMPHPYPAPSV